MAAGRRTSLASLAGQKVDDVPGRSDPLLLTLPLSTMVPTRFNPRRSFGTEDDLREFGLKLKKRQLQPAVVVSRAAYLKLWPEEADCVESAPYVIANGERRFRASLAVGLTTLNVVHNEDVAKSRADFLDAVLSENNDREDLDPIERAIGIETMVEQLGGAHQVAAHYGKTKGWVSQQRKLLKLTPELRALVSQGEMPIRIARDIAGLPHPEQVEAWALEVRRRAEAERAPRAPRASKVTAAAPVAMPSPQASPESTRFTAVNRSLSAAPQPDPVSTQPAGDPSRFTAVNQAAPPAGEGPSSQEPLDVAPQSAEPQHVPDPRSPAPAPSQAQRSSFFVPWTDGAAAMDLFFARIPEAERHRAINRYAELLGSPEAFVSDLAAATDPAFRAQVAELLLKDL
ncbi:ParB N-terminal domain-containing protein [Streptomyces sp. Isolate_45]|uniref:ParB/RepB/Spo0J family partition protein n=1 Tax=Streptomyces sp. Isolate_45 TaxID=2950111 RepID=UPI002481B7F9|nr:ParB N-terminal domain-containing protein [Streptomyces sp. Isolate_45]MDA5281203.1 ParB N-terminal domain-containing protein [Streptomyces sp. Isolate_45]